MCFRPSLLAGHKFYNLLLQFASYVLLCRMEHDFPGSACKVPSMAPLNKGATPALASLSLEALKAHNIRLCKRCVVAYCRDLRDGCLSLAATITMGYP